MSASSALVVGHSYKELIQGRVDPFTITDLYAFMLTHRLSQEGIQRILIFLIYAKELETFVLDRIQIAYYDKSVIDLTTSYYDEYQGGVEMAHEIKFEDLPMYCRIRINSVNIRNQREALGFWKG